VDWEEQAASNKISPGIYKTGIFKPMKLVTIELKKHTIHIIIGWNI
jgi:hypothetical protein